MNFWNYDSWKTTNWEAEQAEEDAYLEANKEFIEEQEWEAARTQYEDGDNT